MPELVSWLVRVLAVVMTAGGVFVVFGSAFSMPSSVRDPRATRQDR